MTPEGKVKALIVKWLKGHGIPYWTVIPSAMGNSRGMSDYCCILPKSGRWLAIEAKALGKKGNTTVHQDNFIATINGAGGYAFVVEKQQDLDCMELILNLKDEL